MATRCPGLILIAACAALVTTANNAIAADIRVVTAGEGTEHAVAIEGLIARGDFAAFIRLVGEQQAAIAGVYLFSAGGDFGEAMKIGRAIRTLELSSRVPMRASSDRPSCDGAVVPNNRSNCTCASACFFIHVGSMHRGGDYLAVHRPYFPRGAFGQLSQRDAMKAFTALQRTAAAYMDDMGVPAHVQEDVLGTPSDRTLVLDDKTIQTYFQGDLPYRDEWTRNRCGRLTGEERARLGSAAVARPDGREASDLRDLRNRQREERDCAAAVRTESRRAAHEKYFGRKGGKDIPR